ncbi:M28 family peptidase [Streptomyces lunalinharesii]|uniref:M20/M25/M40 family metallo-hydrolase n=1 Tax=Streptomyces lunalinharesii TaxID=333384 RepID=A0ABN3RQE9_9ACTN
MAPARSDAGERGARTPAPRRPAARRRVLAPAAATGPRWVFPAAALALAALCVLLTAWSGRLPPARGPAAPAGAFSAARAAEHLRAIATEPRPSGSAAHARTRAYLVRTLQALGIEARVRSGAAVTHIPDLSPTGADARFANLGLHNVVARIPGTAGTRPVALVTHYDSTEAGPGANDAGVPVSVLLETARALRSGPPPRNDVLLVFTDAEESGLLGSRALVDSPAAFPRDAVVLNFEARGSHGPSLMFETGRDAAWLVDALVANAPDARTSSLLNAAYRYMPNLTDFTVFKEAGHPGLNLAYLDGYTVYHGPDDTPGHVDPRTVQHQGEQALALARALGAADLSHPPPGDAVYFSAAGWFVTYPVAAALPLALAVAALGLALLLRLRARNAVTWRGTAGGLLLAACHPLLAAGAAFALAPLTASGDPQFARYYDTADHGPALAGFLLLTLALGGALALLARRRVAARHQVAGAVALWTGLACVAAVLLPGGSHVFTWPALGFVLATAVLTCRAGTTAAGRITAAALGVLPLGLLVVPLVPLLTAALGLGLIAGPVAVAALTTPLLPALGTAVPRSVARAVPVAAAVLALAVLGSTAVLPPAGARPARGDVLYLLDADSRRAHWLSGSPPDAWSERYVPAAAGPAPVDDLWPGWRVPVRRGPATAFPLAAPRVTTTVVADRGTGGRRVRIAAASRRGARELVLIVTGAPVRGYAVTGIPAQREAGPPGGAPWELWLRQVPAGGAEVVLDLAPGPVTVRALDRTPGLPDRAAARPAGPRPPALGVAAIGEATLVATRRRLE